LAQGFWRPESSGDTFLSNLLPSIPPPYPPGCSAMLATPLLAIALALPLAIVGASPDLSGASPSSAAASAPEVVALAADDTCATEHCGLGLLQTRSEALRVHAAQGEELGHRALGAKRGAKAVPPDFITDPMYNWLKAALPGQWGDIIDAGTGPESLAWLATCPVSTITAVTANESSKASTLNMVSSYLDPARDKILVGKWQDPEFLKGHQYDVVVADWLLGSVEFFAPHFQVHLLRRLKGLVKPGGWILFNGREPDSLKKANSTMGQVILDVDALRDAAMLLSLQHPYREIPQWWVEDELKNLGFEIRKRHVEALPIDPAYTLSQLHWAGDMIEKVRDEQLRSALQQRYQQLDKLLKEVKPSPDKDFTGHSYGLLVQLPA